MKVRSVETSQREQVVDITHLVGDAVFDLSLDHGVCFVFCPHTTAGLTINECADPAVGIDIRKALERLVPDRRDWQHVEGNSPAHVKASLMGASVMIPVVDGMLRRGTWQGVLLCEFDGPRTREVWIQTGS